MTDEAEIPLASMIQALRRELLRAEAGGKNEDLQFTVGDIELELQVGVTTEGEAKTEIKFWVLSLGATGSVAKERVQTVRLRLTPATSKGDVVVADTPGGRPR
jgi:Trypsin-co-occurring domain 2